MPLQYFPLCFRQHNALGSILFLFFLQRNYRKQSRTLLHIWFILFELRIFLITILNAQRLLNVLTVPIFKPKVSEERVVVQGLYSVSNEALFFIMFVRAILRIDCLYHIESRTHSMRFQLERITGLKRFIGISASCFKVRKFERTRNSPIH